MTILDTFVWHHREGLPQQLAATGHTGALVKGGVDSAPGQPPVLWTPSANPPAWAPPQWTPAVLDQYRAAGVEPSLFLYTTFGRQNSQQAEADAIAQLCAIWLPRRVVFNFEVETDDMTDAEVNAYFDTVTATLTRAVAVVPAYDNSSVPSWDGADGSRYHHVPYRAVSARTERDYFQDYWKPFTWEDGYEQRYLAQGPTKVVVPVAPAWGPEFTDADVVDFARWARARGYGGMSTWEAGNSAYLWGGVGAAYAEWARLAGAGERVLPGRAVGLAAGWTGGGDWPARWRRANAAA